MIVVSIGLVAVGVGAADSSSELVVAWWGGMGEIEYPATGERNAAVVKQAQAGLARFRDEHPDALMLDVGGFVGPTCGIESSYAMPPLPFYESIGVNAVNIGEGDWLNLVPANTLGRMPKPETTALLSVVRMKDGTQPNAVTPAVAATIAGRTVILAGVARIHRTVYADSQWMLLDTEQDPGEALNEAVAGLKKQHPDAPVVVLAELPGVENIAGLEPRAEMERKESVTVGLGAGIDLVLTNDVVETIKPVKNLVVPQDLLKTDASERDRACHTVDLASVGRKLWSAGRLEAGKLAVARIRFDAKGGIESVEMQNPVELVPVEKSKGNLWTWLGLASKPQAKRVLADPAPKPIVGINLRDPQAIAEQMGYRGATIQAARCDVSDAIHNRVSNKRILGFTVSHDGREVGNLYRVNLELPNSNGSLIANLILDREGKIVRATPKIEPSIGLRFTLLSKILEEWEGLEPRQIDVGGDRYPGLAGHMRLLKDAFVLAAEINEACR